MPRRHCSQRIHLRRYYRHRIYVVPSYDGSEQVALGHGDVDEHSMPGTSLCVAARGGDPPDIHGVQVSV